MCRLLITTTTLKANEALRLIKDTARRFAPSQKDGFGFAAFDRDGMLLARGRYFDSYEGWRNTSKSQAIEEGSLQGKVIQTLIIHGRTSTNILGVDYCHPYKEGNTFLAHNGVLSWKGHGKDKPAHPNDSGAFLQWLESSDFPNATGWKEKWSGYGAIALMREGRGLRVVKCASTRLTLTPARSGGYILSTSPSDVPMTMAEKGSEPRWLKKGDLEFNRKTGELDKVRPFPGFGVRVWDAKAARALASTKPK